MEQNTVRPRLYRSRDHRIIAGVCAGVAEYFGLSRAGLRWLTLILILLGGLSLWVYIILWILLPVAPHPNR